MQPKPVIRLDSAERYLLVVGDGPPAPVPGPLSAYCLGAMTRAGGGGDNPVCVAEPGRPTGRALLAALTMWRPGGGHYAGQTTAIVDALRGGRRVMFLPVRMAGRGRDGRPRPRTPEAGADKPKLMRPCLPTPVSGSGPEPTYHYVAEVWGERPMAVPDDFGGVVRRRSFGRTGE
jgi:hypothetical protein